MNKRLYLPKFPHQFTFNLGLRIRLMLTRLTDRLVPAPMAVYEKAQGIWISGAIGTACELNIADHLAPGPKSIMELARKTNADEDFLYRLMRALAGEGIFKEMPGKVFANNRLSLPLADGEKSMKYMIRHQFGETNMTLFLHLTESIREGQGNSQKFLGKRVFQYLQDHPLNNDIYNQAMNSSSNLVAVALLSAYRFKGIKTLVDVGGGQGVLLKLIIEKHKHIRGILYDQKHVTQKADMVLKESSDKGKIEIVSGNFFTDVPAGADGYFMKNILHAFHDTDCIRLLKKIHEVMPDHGKVIILENVTFPDNKPSFGKRLDLMMMTGTDGGKERTREEFESLLDRSGFRLKRFIRTISPFFVLEAIKK
ncbi:MAG: hypothetical protein KBC43_11220 [Bacteroidales bacterium]|nr:hypothetical protein [Bacteroidales bacterium]